MEGAADAGRHHLGVAAAFVALFMLHATVLVLPAARDARPLDAAEASQMRAAWAYRAGRASLASPPDSPGQPVRPPFVHAVMSAGVRLAAPLGLEPEDGALLANLFFLMLLAWAAYLLAADWWGEWPGVAAAVLASSLPPLVAAARHVQTDVGLAALTAMAYAAWSHTRGFARWGWTLVLSATAAAGLLTSPAFAVCAAPVLLHGLWTLLRRGSMLQDRVRAAAAGAFTAALALPWYVHNLPGLVARNIPAPAPGKIGGLDALFFHLIAVKDGVGWVGVLAAAAGLVWLVIWKTRNGWTLAAWFFSAYAFWSAATHRDPRQLLPALPALALAAAGLPIRLPEGLAVLSAGAMLWTAWTGSPRAPVWPLGEIVRHAAEARRDERGGPAVLAVLSDHVYVNDETLTWTAERERVEDAFIVRGPSGGVEMAELVLVKTRDAGPSRAAAQARDEALRADGWFQKNFEKESSWPFPDGSEALLFRRRPAADVPGVPMAPTAALPRLLPAAAVSGAEGGCAGGALADGSSDCQVAAATFRAKGLTLHDVRVSLDALRLAADDEGRPRVTALKRVELKSGRLTGAEAALFLEDRVRELKDVEVLFAEGGEANVRGRYKGWPARLRARLSVEGDAVRIEILSAKASGFPVPCRRAVLLSLSAGRSRPYAVGLKGLRTDTASNALEVMP